MKRKINGFTLVELVITIAIVIILSVVSVPIYRSYIDKAKMSEGYALLGTIISAQKSYYSEYGNFLVYNDSSKETNNEPILGIDARGNKYFSRFYVNGRNSAEKYELHAYIFKPADIGNSSRKFLALCFNITSGSTFSEVDSF